MAKNVYKYDNREFYSVKELAAYTGINYSTLKWRLKAGIPVDIACQKGKLDSRYTASTVYTYDNHEFYSIKALAEYAEISYGTLYERLKKGMPVDAACRKSKPAYIYDNHEFHSVKALAEYAGVNEKTVYARLKREMSVDDACKKEKLSGRYMEFGKGGRKTLAQICREQGKDAALVGNRLRYGYSLDNALNKPKKISKQGRPVEVNGILYKSVAAALRALGLEHREETVRSRLKKGMKPDDAFCFKDDA